MQEEQESPDISETPVKKKSGWFRVMRNKYLLLTVFFIAWMLFFDNNNWFYLNRLSGEVDQKRKEKSWYEKEIRESERKLQELTTNLKALEKFGRENYYMKKKEEDVYIFLEKTDSTGRSH
jgi:hypothetical protein